MSADAGFHVQRTDSGILGLNPASELWNVNYVDREEGVGICWNVKHADAVTALEQHIAGAQVALAALQRRQEIPEREQ